VIGSRKVLPEQSTPPLLLEKPTTLLELQTRIEAALRNSGLDGKPSFALGAVPLSAIDIPTLIASRESPVVTILRQPPEIRHNGFGLFASNEAPLVENGRARRAVAPVKPCWNCGGMEP
jgi:hypothetical protein